MPRSHWSADCSASIGSLAQVLATSYRDPVALSFALKGLVSAPFAAQHCQVALGSRERCLLQSRSVCQLTTTLPAGHSNLPGIMADYGVVTARMAQQMAARALHLGPRSIRVRDQTASSLTDDPDRPLALHVLQRSASRAGATHKIDGEDVMKHIRGAPPARARAAAVPGEPCPDKNRCSQLVFVSLLSHGHDVKSRASDSPRRRKWGWCQAKAKKAAGRPPRF
ncbi:hypothetical protein J3F83DRAFT_744063 [Trichoderma novae-zelandiae]